MKPDRNLPTENPSAFIQDDTNGALKRRLQNQLNEANSYWNGGNDTKRNLNKDRKRNYQWWIGNHYEDVDLYEHNVAYVNNRIYVSVESSIGVAVAREAAVSILPGSDKPIQQQFAVDLEKSIVRIAQKRKLKKKMKAAARNLLTKYVGLLEPVFDGSINDIDFTVVNPEDVVPSPNSNMFEEPDFYVRKRYGTAKQIAKKFPDQADAIKTQFALVTDELFRNDTKRRTYAEVWYDDYDENDDLVVRCAFYTINDWNLGLQLGIIDNPHWLPEDDPMGRRNFFEKQRKPMIFINHQNSGDTKIDDNAAIDQQIPMNRILNKRGRQITENADEASGGMVYNSSMISKEDMALLIGAPDEKIGVNGPVNDAIARVTPAVLPAYVMNDKIDARNQIDELGATTQATNDGKSKYGTLGEAVIQQQQDYTRQNGLSEAVEDGYLQCYEWTVQLMKCWYDEEKTITVRGEDGQFDYVMMQSDKIEDGIDISVVTGSSGPLNKEQNQTAAQNWLEAGIIDPLTVFEVYSTGQLPSPTRMLDRLMKWQGDPASYADAMKKEEFDRNAQVDIEVLLRGQMPKPRSEVTPEYLDTIIEYMTSGPFLDLPDESKQMFTQYLKTSTERAAQLLQMREGLRQEASQILSPAEPVVINPANTDPNTTPPPGPPPPEMVEQLQKTGAIDARGNPTSAPTPASAEQ